MSDIVRTWRHIQQRYNLVGTKCNTCGKVYFPSRVICPEPNVTLVEKFISHLE